MKRGFWFHHKKLDIILYVGGTLQQHITHQSAEKQEEISSQHIIFIILVFFLMTLGNIFFKKQNCISTFVYITNPYFCTFFYWKFIVLPILSSFLFCVETIFFWLEFYLALGVDPPWSPLLCFIWLWFLPINIFCFAWQLSVILEVNVGRFSFVFVELYLHCVNSLV